MSKGLGKYAGDKPKFKFKVYRQRHKKACGLACLRMLEHWVSGKAQSEAQWQTASAWTAQKGLPVPEMSAALRSIPGIRAPRVPGPMIQQWCANPTMPPALSADSVYLLFTDSYDFDGGNVGHWMILRDIFDAADGRKLALCADPLQSSLQVWSWESLLASRVLRGIQVHRLQSAEH